MVLMVDILNMIATGARDQIFMAIGGNTARSDTGGKMTTIHQLVFATRKLRIRIHVRRSRMLEKAAYVTTLGEAQETQETALVIATSAENSTGVENLAVSATARLTKQTRAPSGKTISVA
jgi:hypothetical protein